MPTAKVSVAIDEDALEWARTVARREGKSLSAVVSESLAQQKRLAAMREVLNWMGEGKPPLTEAELEAARQELGLSTRRAPKRRARKTNSARRR